MGYPNGHTVWLAEAHERPMPVPHFELRYIQPEGIDEFWPKMRVEIAAIIERDPEVCTFLPEEIYICVRRKVADLYVGYLDGEYAGFGVLQERLMDFSRERFLLSWIGGGLQTEAVNLYFAELEKIARSRGIKVIRHESGRMGWDRRKPGPGWKTVSITQEKRLED